MKFKNFDCLGIDFKRAGKILPTLCGNIPFTYKPHQPGSKYYNNPNYGVMRLPKALYGITEHNNEKIGDKEFCHICVAESPCREEDGRTINLPDRTGVYMWVINDTVVYVGRAHTKNQTLYKRYKNGYSNISARPCVFRINLDGSHTNGQVTNMKMNRLVLNSYNNGVEINLYYYECENAAEVESRLIAENWAKRIYTPMGYYPLMYNSRH